MSKKSMVEEALFQIKNVEDAINKNAQGILSSTMKKEISSLVKESLMEQEEITEPETTDVPVDQTMEPEMMGDEAGMQSQEPEMTGDEAGMEAGMEDVEEVPTDDETVDLTGASDAEVLKVFKAMGDSDGIVVTKDNNIITLNDGDEEYIIKINEQLEKENMENELDEMFNEEWEDVEDFDFEDEDEEYEEDLLEFEDEDFLKSADKFYSHHEDEDEEDEFEMDDEDEEDEFEMDDEWDAPSPSDDFMPKARWNTPLSDYDEDEDEEDEFEETIYEIELDEDAFGTEMEEMMYESKSFKPKGRVGKVKKINYTSNTKGGFNEKKKEAFGKGTKAVGTGKAKFEYKDGENLDGEFKVKPKKVEAKEASRFVKSIDRKVKRGLMAAPSQIKEEVIELRNKNEEYKKALDLFRTKLNEVAVFNSNLAYATRLFTEHSTTKQEKINILRRFDNAETLKESKNLYRTIKNEISNSSLNESVSLNESIERRVSKAPASGSAVNLIESKTYENPQFMRMKDLMTKIK
jgi:hypothetical protein